MLARENNVLASRYVFSKNCFVLWIVALESSVFNSLVARVFWTFLFSGLFTMFVMGNIVDQGSHRRSSSTRTKTTRTPEGTNYAPAIGLIHSQTMQSDHASSPDFCRVLSMYSSQPLSALSRTKIRS